MSKIYEVKEEELKVKEEDGLEIGRDNTTNLRERVIEKSSEAGNYLTKEALDETLKTVQSMFGEERKWNEV